MSGETKQESRLVAGDESIGNFCLEIFSIPDPIIVIWTTEDKPKSSNYSTGDNLENEVQLYSKEHLNSLFFPNGFLRDEWNLVIISVKDEHLEKHPQIKQLLKGWMMGVDVNSLLEFDSNFSVRMP